MSKVDDYRKTLKRLDDWDDYLRAESNLPGPRGNLELAHAAADLEDHERIQHFLTFTPQLAPVNTPDEFLAFCGVEGLGRLIAEGQSDLWPTLRTFASDPRWRIREGAARSGSTVLASHWTTRTPALAARAAPAAPPRNMPVM